MKRPQFRLVEGSRPTMWALLTLMAWVGAIGLYSLWTVATG